MRRLIIHFLLSEDGFLSAIAGFLGKAFTAKAIGSAALGLGASVIGNKIGAKRDLSNAARDRAMEFDYYRSQGATIPETLGVAGSTSAGDAGQATMGNAANQLMAQNRQMAYDAEQRQLDREVAMRGQDAGIQAAQTSAGASIYSSNTQAQIAEAKLALETDRFRNIQLPQALNDIATSTPEWKRQELLATMGVDNVMATTIASGYGLDVMDPETIKGLSEREFVDLIRTIYGLQSTIFRESSGVAIQGNALRSDVGAAVGNLGSGASSGPMSAPTGPSSPYLQYQPGG